MVEEREFREIREDREFREDREDREIRELLKFPKFPKFLISAAPSHAPLFRSRYCTFGNFHYLCMLYARMRACA